MNGPHPAIVITTLIDELPAGTRVLDLGAGSGTFPYDNYPRLRIAAADLYPRADARSRFSERLVQARADCLPFPTASFDLVLAHWLFEHVDDLQGTYDEVTRVLRPGGLLAVAVPNSHSFEDRFYRFTSHVYKYALFHFKKRIEHVQVLTFLGINQALYRRGFRLLAFREEGAGYCWLEVRQLRRFRPLILGALHALRRAGLDLFAGANFRLLYRLEGGDAQGGEFYCSTYLVDEARQGTRAGATLRGG
jgi:SAM-dependent methyltransferase